MGILGHGLSRRGFLKATAATGAALTLGIGDVMLICKHLRSCERPSKPERKR